MFEILSDYFYNSPESYLQLKDDDCPAKDMYK